MDGHRRETTLGRWSAREPCAESCVGLSCAGPRSSARRGAPLPVVLPRRAGDPPACPGGSPPVIRPGRAGNDAWLSIAQAGPRLLDSDCNWDPAPVGSRFTLALDVGRRCGRAWRTPLHKGGVLFVTRPQATRFSQLCDAFTPCCSLPRARLHGGAREKQGIIRPGQDDQRGPRRPCRDLRGRAQSGRAGLYAWPVPASTRRPSPCRRRRSGDGCDAAVHACTRHDRANATSRAAAFVAARRESTTAHRHRPAGQRAGRDILWTPPTCATS